MEARGCTQSDNGIPTSAIPTSAIPPQPVHPASYSPTQPTHLEVSDDICIPPDR